LLRVLTLRLLLLRVLTRLLLLWVLTRLLLLRVLALRILLLRVLTLLASLELVIGFRLAAAASNQGAAGDQTTESNQKKGT
jgi:hypothetical protein